MANLQLYTLLAVYVDGSLLTEEFSCTIKRSTNAQDVITVAKGFAGLSPGAPMVTIEVESAVPAADFELDPGKFMKNLGTAEVTLFGAGRSFTVKGFIVEDSFSHAANSEAKMSFSFKAPYENWI